MDLDRIQAALAERFDQDGHRIVFWNDPDAEFASLLGELDLDGIALVRLDQEPALGVKVRVELENPSGRYLLYAPTPPPAPEEDWLLDMRLYGGAFSADRASMLLADLGLARQALRGHLAARGRFFASRDRLERFAKLVSPDDDADDIDRKIIAVLTRADQPELFSLLIALFDGMPGADPDAVPAVWPELAKHGVEETFWGLVQRCFGWQENAPTLGKLLIRLMVADFAVACRGALPTGLKHLVLPRQGSANAVVCLAQWRDSSSRGASFDALSARVAASLKLEQHLGALDVEDLVEVMTFLMVEQAVASRLRDRVLAAGQAVQPAPVLDIVSRRQAGHWATTALPDRPGVARRALHAVYQALAAATELFALLGAQGMVPTPAGAKPLFDGYIKGGYRVDQCYRHFCAAADFAKAEGWDILKALRERVEDAYGNGFVAELALAWNAALEGGLLGDWRIDGVPNQQGFFAREVAPVLAKAADRRVFVIISDALRFEAAAELVERLNGRYRFDAALSAQLGVLPSYTALGMAALLPHARLEFDRGGTLRVDGLACGSLEQRSAVLAAHQGVAVKAETLMGMKQAEGRALIKPHRVVYVYHNRIDAVGDAAATEAQTFDAVQDGLTELADLVSKIVNSLNGNHVLITADHGFLFRERAPVETDKSSLDEKPAGTMKAKKRYLLGRNLPARDNLFHGSTRVTAGAEGDMDFWVPKGTNRFHFVSGSRFLHGGAMPQEVAVPVILVQHQKQGSQAARTQTRGVGVSVLGNNFKVTTNRHRFQLIQTEAVGERVKPVTLKVAIYDGEEPVTNVETVTFDSTSKDMNQWQRVVALTLAGRSFDSKRLYQLVLRDADSGIEEARFDVTIDLAFTNDF
jgi:uncharacterized protein (TIGR02687 family)